MKTRPLKKDQESLFSSNQQKREAILKYSQLVLKGESFQRISEELNQEFGFSEMQSMAFMKGVRDTIAEVTAENNEHIVQIHLELYEDIYKRFDNLGHAKGKMKVMEQKEKLLKLYEEETNEVVVNTQNNLIIESHYDTSKLTLQQQARFQQLLEKAIRKTDD